MKAKGHRSMAVRSACGERIGGAGDRDRQVAGTRLLTGPVSAVIGAPNAHAGRHEVSRGGGPGPTVMVIRRWP